MRVRSMVKAFLIAFIAIQAATLYVAIPNLSTIRLFILVGVATSLLINLIFFSSVLKYFSSRSLETLFFMNTTLFMACLGIRDNIFKFIIKDSIGKINTEVNGSN